MKFSNFIVEWDTEAKEEELSVWEDNWDDDNLDNMDDFTEQLKQHISAPPK